MYNDFFLFEWHVNVRQDSSQNSIKTKGLKFKLEVTQQNENNQRMMLNFHHSVKENSFH